jgi:GAF domain-containing protein
VSSVAVDPLLPDRIASALDRERDVPALLRTTARELVHLIDAAACTISRAIGELLVDVAEYSRTGAPVQVGHGYLIEDFPLTLEVLDQKAPRNVFRSDPDADRSEVDLLRQLGFEQLLMLPLVTRGETWGLVEVYAHDDASFGDREVELGTTLLERTAALLAQLEATA